MEIGLVLARREDALEPMEVREEKGKVLGVMKGVVWSWLAFKSAEARGRVHSTS